MSTPFGGAANAALRLHLGLLENNIKSKVLTLGVRKDFPEIYSYADINRWGWLKNPVIKKKSKKHYFKTFETFKGKTFTPEKFTLPTSPYKIENHPLVKEADLINLHWVSEFINVPTFFDEVKKPIVWTLHDMNAFTGGCHYSFDCLEFIIGACARCPQLIGVEKTDLANNSFEIKQKSYKNQNITIVTPSKWLYSESNKSPLTRVFEKRIIPYGISDSVFYPYNKKDIRNLLNLPLDKKLVLFVADSINNYRKGIKYIVETSKLLSTEYKFLLVGMGNYEDENFIHLGEVKDESKMAQIYSAADLFVIPSLADNLPNTVLESLFCGTPVVGFKIGGISDMVIDGFNGFLCKEINSLGIAKTVENTLNYSFNQDLIVNDANERFNLEKQALNYIELYKSLFK
jgi:glycosyltransferase involved in cell wall biosynthesis